MKVQSGAVLEGLIAWQRMSGMEEHCIQLQKGKGRKLNISIKCKLRQSIVNGPLGLS